MSDVEDQRSGYKKRRLQGACDECKRRKVKCDSATRPDNICSSCTTLAIECTHAAEKKRRGPPKGTPRKKRTVQTIVDSLLSVGKHYNPPHDPSSVKKLLVEFAVYIRELEEEISKLKESLVLEDTVIQKPSISDTSSPGPSLSSDADVHAIEIGLSSHQSTNPPEDASDIQGLTSQLECMGLHTEQKDDRHFSQLSNVVLLKVKNIKKEYPGKGVYYNANFQRPEFWAIQPWQNFPEDVPKPYEFPEDDLLRNLIDLFFENVNINFPVLHRPSFSTSVASNLHLEDRHFGALTLAVCAVGSRYTTDVRVLEDGITSRQSAGWKYIRQIILFKKSFSNPPSIYEPALYILVMWFTQPTTTPDFGWVLTALGMRFVQEMGANRRKSKLTVENQQWLRIFWAYYATDTFVSAHLGRPRCISVQDYDVHLPLEIDDEYWETEDPEMAFKQPDGKKAPSTSYWVCFLKLVTILGYAMRTLYAVRPLRQPGLSTVEWNQKIVTELDSLLNKWVDEIPTHLKWDPGRENSEHFRHSVILYTTYYWLQILVHRPYLPRPGDDSPLAFASLAICSHAARSCLRVIDVQEKRNFGMLHFSNVMFAGFNSSIIILVNLKRTDSISSIHYEQEFADVERFVETLQRYEDRFNIAGRFYDILTQIISVSRPNLEMAPATKMKRTRGETNIDDSSPSSVSSGSVTAPAQSVVGIPPISDQTAGRFNTHLPFFNISSNSNQSGNLPVPESFPPPTEQWEVFAEKHLRSQSTTPIDSAQLFHFVPPGQSDVQPFSKSIHSQSIPSVESIQGAFAYDSNSAYVPAPMLVDKSISPNQDEWTTYMASVDEILQALNGR